MRQSHTYFWISAASCSLTAGIIMPANGQRSNFKFKFSDIEDRHHLIFEIYEKGKITLEEYLNLMVLFQKRSFTRAQFRRFMFAQSKPYSEMIEMVTQLKVRHRLKIVVVSNEARELNAYRIERSS